MISITASIISFIYITLICIVFFSKERIRSKETKIFSSMLKASLIGITMDSISGILYLTGYNVNSFFYILLTKSIITFYVVWDLLMLSYILIISYNEDDKQLNIFLSLNNFFTKVLGIAIFCLPLKIVKNENLVYPSGISIILMYIINLIYLLIYLVVERVCEKVI